MDARDILATVGLVLLAAGSWAVYPPAGLVVPGAICCCWAFRPPTRSTTNKSRKP